MQHRQPATRERQPRANHHKTPLQRKTKLHQHHCGFPNIHTILLPFYSYDKPLNVWNTLQEQSLLTKKRIIFYAKEVTLKIKWVWISKKHGCQCNLFMKQSHATTAIIMIMKLFEWWMNLKILICCNVMYRLMGTIVARFILQNNFARREAVFVHPRFQVLLVLLSVAGDYRTAACK